MKSNNFKHQDPTRLNHIRLNLDKKTSLASAISNDGSPELRKQDSIPVPQSIYDHHIGTPERMPFTGDPSKKWDFQTAAKESEDRMMKMEIEKRMHAMNLYQVDQDGKKMSVIHFIEENLQGERREVRQSRKSKMSALKLPKRQAIFTFILLLVGIILLIVGIVVASKSDNSNRAIAFWITGGICALPGFYFALRFCQGYYAKSVEEKRRVLQDIPHDV